MAGYRTEWIEFVPVFTEDGDGGENGAEVTIELVSPSAPVVVRSAATVRRVLGWIAVAAGAIGMAIGVALIWLGVGIVERAGATIDDGLAIADDTLAAILDTIDVADRTIATTSASLAEMRASLGSVGGSIRRVDGLLGETADVVAGDVAESIDSLLAALPGLIDVGDTLDRTLRSLSLLGVPYDPDQQVGDGFREMEAALVDVPDRLRLQGELLDDMRADLVSTGGSLARVRADLGEIRVELVETTELLVRYREAASDGVEVVADIRAQVDGAVPVARWVLIGLGAFFILYQLVPMYLGWRLTRGDRLVGG